MTQTKPAVAGEPTQSSDDPQLYDYTPEDAPKDVVINIGGAPLMVAAPHAVNDPHRMEIGDRRRGAYYVSLLGKMPGLMQLHRVDLNRLAQVQKVRAVRIGDREPDWVIEARRRSEQKGATQPPGYINPHSDLTPLQRAAKGI